MYSFSDNIFLISQCLVNHYIARRKREIQTCLMSKFIKYLIDIKAHCTIKRKIVTNKVCLYNF